MRRKQGRGEEWLTDARRWRSLGGMLSVDEMIELEILAREEVERLMAETEAAGDSAAPVAPDVAIGRISRMDSIQIQQMAKEAQRRRELRLRLLGEALGRMDTGEFGACEQCGGPIGYERLKSAPELILCGACAR